MVKSSMKAVLEFALPDDQPNFECAVRGLDFSIFIDDLLKELRSTLRHDSGEFKDCDPETCEEIRDWITEEMRNRNFPSL